jgi:hypothetical protein
LTIWMRQWEIDGMELDDLIGRVHGDDPLARLGSAVQVKANLDDLTDRLIGHFVQGARDAGHSWSEIGAAMGVTKQAAQQRHSAERPPRRPARMFTRFTVKAKAAIADAKGAAGDGSLGVEHLLAGVAAQEDCLGAVVLAELGVVPRPPAHVAGRRGAFTPSAKKIVELALREALALHHGYVGTEHLLLALHRQSPGLLPGVTREQLLDAIARHQVAA